MFTVTKYPQGAFSWVDHNSTDPVASKAFYSALMDWTYEDRPITGTDMTYTMFFKDGHAVAGGGQATPGTPSNWTNYVAVDDVEAVAKLAVELGATLLVPPMDVMNEGRMAMIQDPTGAVLGLWQAKAHIGAGLVNTVGALCWNELNTRDSKAAQDFFHKLFGWEFQTLPSNYTMFKNKGRSNGGIIQMDEKWGELPPHWIAYFTVADIEASVNKAVALGGKSPFPIMEADGMRFAVIEDPQGAAFMLIQSEQVDPWVE